MGLAKSNNFFDGPREICVETNIGIGQVVKLKVSFNDKLLVAMINEI